MAMTRLASSGDSTPSFIGANIGQTTNDAYRYPTNKYEFLLVYLRGKWQNEKANDL
jgi:hypothetical protein